MMAGGRAGDGLTRVGDCYLLVVILGDCCVFCSCDTHLALIEIFGVSG